MNAHQRKKNAKAFIAELKAHCDDEKISSLLEAADDLRKLDKENEQLRQRVAELEKDCDEFEGNAAQWEQEYYKVSKERDKATQYWRIAEGRCDARIKKRDDLLSALENCRLLAARHSKEEWATHILRFCAESGVIGSPIRDFELTANIVKLSR